MENIRFNSAPNSLFEAKSGTNDGVISERDKLVAIGKLLTFEANGREKNRIRTSAGQTPASYDSRLPQGMDYRTESERYRTKLLLFCAKMAKNASGEHAPSTYEEFLVNQRDYFNDPAFIRNLSGIARDILRPFLPYTVSNALGELGQMVEVGFGETYEISVPSNDVMIFSDSSWGASRSVPEQTLYDYPITLNPTMKAAKTTVKWRQLAANNGGDIGAWLNSLAAGMYSKIMAMWSQVLVQSTDSTFFTPAYLTKSSFTSNNFISLAKSVSEVNHVDKRNLICYGDWLALSHILPNGTTQDAALTYGLGSEWNSNGYLGTTLGVPCHMWQNVIVPGTQNTTGTEVLPTNQVWIAAANGEGYAPLYIGMEKGTPIQLELEPSRSADMSLSVNLSMAVDVKAVFGTKVGTIKNV